MFVSNVLRCAKPQMIGLDLNLQNYWAAKSHGMMDGRISNECTAIFFRCKIIIIVLGIIVRLIIIIILLLH